MRNPLNTRLRIDGNTDPEGLLYDVVLTDPKVIERDLNVAVKAKLVGDATLNKLGSYLQNLERFKSKAEAYQKEQRDKQLIDLATQFVVTDKIGEAMKLFNENRGDLPGVIKQITNVQFLGDTKKVESLRATLAIADIVGNDRPLIDAVAKEHGISKLEDVRKLARLNRQEWEATLTQMQVGERLASVKASALARNFERAYPTQAFAAQLRRDTAPKIKQGKEIAELLIKFDDLDLQKENVDLFYKRAGLGTVTGANANINATMRGELKKIQRVFRPAPNYSTTNALLARGGFNYFYYAFGRILRSAYGAINKY